jgi:hypothetical protein
MRLPEDPQLAADEHKDSWGRYYKTFLDGDLLAFRDGQTHHAVEFGEGSESSRHYETRWSGSASVGWGFFRIGGEASGGTITSHMAREATRVRIEFKNLASFPVRRSTWFQGALIRQYARRVDGARAWGAGGYLNLIPTGLVLGRGLKVTLTVANSTRDEFHNWYQASASLGFSFGPWTIGGGGGSSSRTDEVKVHVADGQITIEDLSNSIFLVACTSERPIDYTAAFDPRALHEAHALYELAAVEDRDVDAVIRAHSTKAPALKFPAH